MTDATTAEPKAGESHKFQAEVAERLTDAMIAANKDFLAWA